MGAAIISYVSLSLWLLQEKDNLDVVEVNASIKILERLGKCCEDLRYSHSVFCNELQRYINN